MPLAIVGNKFQAAYEQEQMASSRSKETNRKNVTKPQRRQRILNEGFIFLGIIDHLQNLVKSNCSKDQRLSAIGNLYKTHQVLITDIASLFPSLKSSVDETILKHSVRVFDEDDDEQEVNTCCAQRKLSKSKVAPINSQYDDSSPGVVKHSTKKSIIKLSDEEIRSEAEASGSWRDKLWLCMELHDSSRCALVGYVIRHIVVILALLACMLMMYHELNRWGEMSPPCQILAAQFCQIIHDLPDDWTYIEHPMLDVSDRYNGYNKSQLLAANPICGTMTCNSGLICSQNNTGELESP